MTTESHIYPTPDGLCPHFGECGGCRSQDVAYDEQLAAKRAELEALFQPYWDGPIPITPSPAVWYYRNKVDLTFGRKFYPEPPPKDFERETVLGFKRKGRWYMPLEIQECRIASPELAALLDGVRAFVREQGLKAFDSRRKEGFLKILLVREGKRTGQRMVAVITHDGEFDQQAFVDAVLAACPVDSIYWGIHRKLSDVAEAEELHLLHGAPCIEEALHVPANGGQRRLTFRISPMSFFQTNTLATELLYGKIREWVQTVSSRELYDIYGGAGGIALTCADLVESVCSVESVASASEDGRINMQQNGVANVEFVTEKTETWLRGRAEEGVCPPDSAVVLDPPRAGMHPKALKRLLQWLPPRILYVSCKPANLASEMESFSEAYAIEHMEAVDLFPHTPHMEAVASLRLKDNAGEWT